MVEQFFQPFRQSVCHYRCYGNLKIQSLTSGTRVGTFIYILKAKKRKTLDNAAFGKIRAYGEDGCIGVVLYDGRMVSERMNDYMTRVHEKREGPTDLGRMNGKKNNCMVITLGKCAPRILQKLVLRSW